MSSCTLDATALSTADSLRQYLDIPIGDDLDDALQVWHDGRNVATLATVEVNLNKELILKWDDAGGSTTHTIDLTDTDSDTMGEVVTEINTHVDTPAWNAILKCPSDRASADLVVLNAVDALTQSNAKTLEYVDNCELVSLINIASDRIFRYINRYIKAAEHTEFVNVRHDGKIIVKHYPLIQVRRVAQGRRGVVKVKNTGSVSTDISALVSLTGTSLVLKRVGGSPAPSDVTVDLSTEDTLTKVVNAIAAAGNGWTASLSDSTLGGMPSSWLIASGALYAYKTEVELDAAEQSSSGYTVDWDSGLIEVASGGGRFGGSILGQSSRDIFSGGGGGAASDSMYSSHPTFAYNAAPVEWFVEYRGGYETVPCEIEWICNEIARELRLLKNVNVTLEEEELGDLRKKFRSGSDIDSGLRSSLRDKLAHWANRWF